MNKALLHIPILLLIIVPLLVMPLFAMVYFAFEGGFSAFWNALTTPAALFALQFSLVIATITSIINLFLGTYIAYVLSRYDFKGNRFLLVLVNLPVAIPTVVVGTSLLLLWGPIGLLGSLLNWHPMFKPAGVLLAHLFVTLPYMVGAVKPVLDESDKTIEEASATLGASSWQTFRLITLPGISGGLISGTLLTFAHSLGEFGATVMVSGNLRFLTQTSPLYIFAQFEAGNIAGANAVASVLAFLSFILFLALVSWSEKK